jgi:hypothetical protein
LHQKDGKPPFTLSLESDSTRGLGFFLICCLVIGSVLQNRVGWLTANDLDHWRTPIDCRDHPEFEVSRVLQTSLPAFNLPKLAAEISSCRTNTGDHLQGQRQTTAAVGPNSPAVSAHSGSVLSHRCANITTLREELQAIQTGISRVLSGFYGPGHQLSVASTPQRPLPPLESDIDASGPWPTSGNSSMSAPAGNMGSSGSTEYSLLSQMLQNHNQIQEEPRIIPPSKTFPPFALPK